MELLKKYFSDLNATQLEHFARLKSIYEQWNSSINVISRKDMENFYERHVLHSLAISKLIKFSDTSDILDIGTGGGFPGIPLAILFPNCNFILVDSIGKKIKVVNEVVKYLELKNVVGVHERAEKIDQQFDFIVSRAVTDLSVFLTWTKDKIKKKQSNSLKNGILSLKGGDLADELKTVRNFHQIYNLSDFFEEYFFKTKKLVYLTN